MKRFAFYQTTLATDRFGQYALLGPKLTDDCAVEGDFPSRASDAGAVAVKIAKERNCRVLVALFDPSDPQDIEPVYFVSPGASYEARRALAAAVHWSEAREEGWKP